MEKKEPDLEAAPAGVEIHPGWQYVEHLFPASWQLKHAKGPASILSPTLAVHEVPHHGVRTITTARRTRKGRHPVIEALSKERKIEHVRPRTLLHPFGYKLWGWAPRNISYWVGMAFTVGSISWVVNGTFAMWPLKNERANLYAVGYTAVLGGFLFELGSVLAFLEMVNSNCKNIDVGHRIEHDHEARTTRVYHSKTDASYHRLDEAAQPLVDKVQNGNGAGVHNGYGFENGVAGEGAGKAGGAPVLNGAERRAEAKQRRRKWLWCAWQPRSLSYWTVTSQLIGATIFGVPACITGVPHVLWFDYPPSHWQGWLVLYWLPQMIGSIFFIINSYLTMVESSHSWFGIKLWDLGWQAGFWNLLGAIGFLLSGFFGALTYPTECCQHWGTFFSTWWGSIFFLISSYLLIPEALNK